MKNLGIVGLCAVALGLLGCSSEPVGHEEPSAVSSELVRGTVENGRNYVMALRIEFTNGTTMFCSSVLFAPRVLLTAAHCIAPDAQRVAARVSAYIGNNYAADFAALGPAPYDAITAAPAPSRFMRADSWETLPGWNPATVANDLAVVYLDRQPRLPPNTIVDPLPLGRTRLGASVVGQLMTLVGYGGSKALTEDISQVEGGRVKRIGTAPFVGAPVTNPLPPHPHPGLGIPSVLNSLFQTNGTAPNANPCAGDSGGPAIRKVSGQDYIFGIGSWTGDWCEKFSYFTRIDPFLPFLDTAYMKGGQAQLAPRTECVTPRADGGLRAYFGYNNQNGVNVTIPRGSNNAFAQDTTNQRPTTFLPGNRPYAFAVNFTSNQTLTYKLVAPSGPNTTLTVNKNSPRCNVNNRSFICAQACDPGLALACGETLEACVRGCVNSYGLFPGCDPEFDAVNRCQAQQPSSSFECFGETAFEISGVCEPLVQNLFACLEG